MADENKVYFSRVKLPDGQIFYVQDIEANEILSHLHAVATSGDFEDLTNKPIIDSEMSDVSVNAVQNKAVKAYIDSLIADYGTVLQYKGVKANEAEIKALTSAKVGDVWIDLEDGSEWISKETFSGAANAGAWERLGPAIDVSEFITEDDLGELAKLDQAEGTVVAKGSIVKEPGTPNFTPEGTISAPTVELELNTANVKTVLNAGTLPSHGEDTYVPPTFTEGQFTQGSAASWSASVVNDMLEFTFTPNTPSAKASDTFTPGSFTSGAFSAGALPTLSEDIAIATSVRSINASAPVFNGTPVHLGFHGEESLVTVGKPYASTFERANVVALRMVSDGLYDNPDNANKTVPAPSYYYVKYCSGTNVPPKFAALAGANDKFLFSIGQNAFIEDLYYKTIDGEFYVAAPIILFEDQKSKKALGINSLTSTNTSMMTVEEMTGTEIPTYTVTQDGSKPAQAYIKFAFDGIEAGELMVTKKVRPLRDGTMEVGYGFDKAPLFLYPFGWTTGNAADNSKYKSGEASYSVAAIDSGKAVTMKLNYVIA